MVPDAHLRPTGQVLGGFDPITPDHRHVVLQGWPTSIWVYRVVAALLLALAVLTGLTGARTSVIWLKTCPVLLTLCAALLVVASLI